MKDGDKMSMNFEALTDAEINRWAVLHDEKLFGDWRFDERCVHNYAASADAALALCERWGYRVYEAGELLLDNREWEVNLFHPSSVGQHLRGKGATLARALLNAACAAKHTQEKDQS